MDEIYDVGFRIKKISDRMEQRANAMLKQVDLTFAQMKVLHYLSGQPDETARLKEIEKFFNVSQPTMAGIAVRLEEKGFVKSSTKPEDHRIKVLTLTQSGRDVCQKSRTQALALKKQTADAMGEESIQQLCALLDKLYVVISREDV